jgi:hypothetical protein
MPLHTKPVDRSAIAHARHVVKRRSYGQRSTLGPVHATALRPARSLSAKEASQQLHRKAALRHLRPSIRNSSETIERGRSAESLPESTTGYGAGDDARMTRQRPWRRPGRRSSAMSATTESLGNKRVFSAKLASTGVAACDQTSRWPFPCLWCQLNILQVGEEACDDPREHILRAIFGVHGGFSEQPVGGYP